MIMTVDLHSHTKFSFCGADDPELLVSEMIKNGVNVLGICDHHYGVEGKEKEYFDTLTRLKEKYKDKITLYRGLEIATVERLPFDTSKDVTCFDYCLIEHIDRSDSSVGLNFIEFSKKLGIKSGIAHTDLFRFVRGKGIDEYKFFKTMKDNGIFWELNVNYDSVHSYTEHAYVKDFFADEKKQAIIKKVGLELSVGFDGHRKEEYKVERVKNACEFLLNNGFNLITEL